MTPASVDYLHMKTGNSMPGLVPVTGIETCIWRFNRWSHGQKSLIQESGHDRTRICDLLHVKQAL